MDRRRVRLILAAILVVGFVLRLAFVLGQRGDPLFEHPVLDEDHYIQQAHVAEDAPYWQPPGIIYVLRATFAIAGDGLLAPRLFQILISVASCALLFAIGRRLFDERVGLVAAAIAALHGVLIFECYELLPATWVVGLDLVALWLVLRAAERKRPLDALLAGLAIGVSAVFAPTILPFAAVAAVLVRRPIAIAALVAGVLLPIAPVTIRNYQHGGELVAISANGGLNLFLGNNEAYRATFSLRPGREWEELTTEPQRHGATRPGEASSYFTHRALAFAAAHPLDEAALVARKAFLFVHGAELPRDTDLYEARHTSWVLAALVWPRFPDGLLIPLALVGVAALWRERRRLAAPLGLLATIAITAVIFFVTARHRAPALPLFALFAAAGFARWARSPRWIAVAAVLVVVCNLPTWETRLSYAGEADFYRGLAALQQHDPREAREAFTRAVAQNPHDARAWFELGNVLAGREAVTAWQQAAISDPWDSRARRRIAQALVQLGDLDGAIATLQASIAAHVRDDTHYAPDHLNLAFMLAQRHRTPEALAELAAATRADPSYVRPRLPRMAAAARQDPSTDPAFLRALEQP